MYCYARSLLEPTGSWLGEPLYARRQTMAKALVSHVHEGDSVRIGSLSDPYQPLEKSHGLTREAIGLLCRNKVRHHVVTKYAYVADEENMASFDKELTEIQITLTSTDDSFAPLYEGGSPVRERIEAIRRLCAAGFNTTIRLSPYVPDFVDAGKLDFDVLASTGCKNILVDFLRTDWRINKSMAGLIDASRYNVCYRRMYHLPVSEKIRYAELLLSRLDGMQVRLDDFCRPHYEALKEHFAGTSCAVMMKGAKNSRNYNSYTEREDDD